MSYSKRDREIDKLCEAWWCWYGELASALHNPKNLSSKKKHARLCSQKCRDIETQLLKYGVPKQREDE